MPDNRVIPEHKDVTKLSLAWMIGDLTDQPGLIGSLIDEIEKVITQNTYDSIRYYMATAIPGLYFRKGVGLTMELTTGLTVFANDKQQAEIEHLLTKEMALLPLFEDLQILEGLDEEDLPMVDDVINSLKAMLASLELYKVRRHAGSE